MYVLIGQKDVKRSDFELRRIIVGIEKDGLGTGFPCKAWTELLEPLSWGIAFKVSYDKELDLANPLGRSVLNLVRRIAYGFGHGKYYFRGIDFPLESFWEMSPNSIFMYDDVFGGLPLCILIESQAVVEIYQDWNDKFINEYCTESTAPLDLYGTFDNRFCLIYKALYSLLSFRGEWLFKLASREPESQSSIPYDVISFPPWQG